VFTSNVAKNSQWTLQGIRGLGGKPPAAGGLGSKSPTLDDFCNFSIKITHFYAYFDQNSYFKATTHQLKVFEKQSERIKRDK